MSREVHVYTIGGGGSIDWVPGVVLAAWGGPGRARGAVRVVPKTRNCITSRVNPSPLFPKPEFRLPRVALGFVTIRLPFGDGSRERARLNALPSPSLVCSLATWRPPPPYQPPSPPPSPACSAPRLRLRARARPTSLPAATLARHYLRLSRGRTDAAAHASHRPSRHPSRRPNRCRSRCPSRCPCRCPS